MSKFHYLSNQEIEASISDGAEHLRACLLDDTTKIAVISIPATSKYLELDQASRLIDMLTQYKLVPNAYKAAGCDDIHIYLSFTELVRSDVLNNLLSRLLKQEGFDLSPEDLLVYPADAPIVLPLQKGFAWLNKQLQVKVSRDDISLESALPLFLSDLNRSAVSFEEVAQSVKDMDQSECFIEVEELLKVPTQPALEACLITGQVPLETQTIDYSVDAADTVDACEQSPLIDLDPALVLFANTDYSDAADVLPESCIADFDAVNMLEVVATDQQTSEFEIRLPEETTEIDIYAVSEFDYSVTDLAEGTTGNESAEAEMIQPAVSTSFEQNTSVDASASDDQVEIVVAASMQLSLFPELIQPQVISSYEVKKPKRPGRPHALSSERSPPGDT
ncbi:MAG: hypothetical protein Q8T09_00825 [Candidatus Melainabacteria bacterium]|nr:hypothetical protein [Candidatus Melainabacteria bacterium]